MILAAGSEEVGVVLLELGAVVVALAVVGRLASRIGLSPIPLYLLAGLVAGVIGIAEDDLSGDFVEVSSEIGVILLLFTLGLEYSADELRNGLRSGMMSGVIDFVANFSPGVIVGIVLGWDPIAVLVLGGITYISSSGIVAKLIADLGRTGNRETPVVLSILVMEDLAMAVYLPIIGVLLVGGGFVAGLTSITIALAAVVVILWVALNHGDLVSRVLQTESNEALLLSVVGFTFLVGGAAQALDVSAAVGAFLVGLALSGGVAKRSQSIIGPLRDLFAATFFLFFGLQIDAGELPRALPIAIALVLVTGATKLATGWWAAARAGLGRQARWRAGSTLIARGEFSIVIAELGVASAIEPDLGALAAAYVLLLALAGPLIARRDTVPAAPSLRWRRGHPPLIEPT